MAIILGVTGSFGSGKSTVSRILAERGIPVQDADQVAKDVVAPGSEALAEIVKAFGEGVLDETGALDRKKMAALVFDDDAARVRLNSLIHPRVFQVQAAFVKANAPLPAVVLDIPLLLEGRGRGAVDYVIVVTTTDEVRLERLKGRGFSPEEVEARLKKQMPQEEKIRLADFTIDNSGTIEETEEQLENILSELGLVNAGPEQD